MTALPGSPIMTQPEVRLSSWEMQRCNRNSSIICCKNSHSGRGGSISQMAALTTSRCGTWPLWASITSISASRRRRHPPGFALVLSPSRPKTFSVWKLYPQRRPSQNETVQQPTRNWGETVMRPDEFQALLRLRPFKPFRVYLSNGSPFEVRHPEMAVVEWSIVWIHTPAANLPIPLAERRVFLVLLHITHGEFIEAAVGPPGNGAKAG